MFRYHLPTLSPGLESSAIPYPMFYRRFGVRRAVQLVAPPLSKLDELDLPRDAILHYLSEDSSEYGPDQSGLILSHQTRMTMCSHQTVLGDAKGPPRPMPIPAMTMARDYHRRNRQTRLLAEGRMDMYIRDPRTLIVENYALLPHLFRYTTSAFSEYYKWWNINARVWAVVDELGQKYDRQQYLMCRLPKFLPTLPFLRRAEVGMSRQLLDRFRDPNALLILEIWKWLGANRSESILAKASPASIAKMNLIWIEGGQWFMVNLGLLDAWRKPTDSEIDAGAEDTGIVPALQLQKRFLRSLMMLLETRVVDTGPETPVETPVTETPAEATTADGAAPPAPPAVPEPVAPSTISVKIETDDGKTKTVKVNRNLDVDSLGEAPVEETPQNIEAIDAQIEAELEALDKFYSATRKVEAERNDQPVADESVELADEIFGGPDEEPVTAVSLQDQPPDEAFIAKVDALAATGAISAPEYARLVKLASQYKSIPNPFGMGTLDEHAIIKPEELKLEQKPIVPDNPVIVDKSMRSSRVADFTANYVKDVLSKDVTGMVLSLQSAGVAVTGYTVEQVEDALGKTEIHKLQVTPVRGKSSTLEFRLPVVEPDGTFRVNGVRYRQRLQRRDTPIRKVGPDKVALTSYYNKIFISRSEKQVNNYPGWITNTIASRGMDVNDERVTQLMLADVFRATDRTPRIYSIMAQRFRSFTIKSFQFHFDYASREAVFGADRVKAAEKNGLVVCGKSGKSLLVVDNNDALYTWADGNLTPIDSMEGLLELDSVGPIERAEIKIFGKQVPVGMFLGYQLGLTKLCEVLGVKPRRVPAGERLYLAPTEYALRFEDEAWVFEQNRKAATLILSGFQAFEKVIRNYPAHLFDRRDIYQNVLETGKVSVRYLREMDLLVDMFVDPITKGILEEMQEPTTFVGLVRRAVELLETDWAPEETDMAYMRICGYERMAGAVYSELVQATRRYRSSGNPGTAKLDIAPFTVFQSIQRDPAVKTVEESNPVHNLKEKEELTYSGVGGRGARSMVKDTRVFHDNDTGVISEASKDSADVGVTTFLSADPNLTGLRGLTGRADLKNIQPATMVSTSMLLAPCADKDDAWVDISTASIDQVTGRCNLLN